jgi:hypothetical protein
MGNFSRFLVYVHLFNAASSAAPSEFTLSEDAGIEPRTVATLALTARRSNLSTRSHPQRVAQCRKFLHQEECLSRSDYWFAFYELYIFFV